MRAGWHLDPEDASRLRWWDGQQWTSATRRVSEEPSLRLTTTPGATAPKTPGEKAQDRKRAMIMIGAGVAVVLILVGFGNMVAGLGGPTSGDDKEMNTRPSGAAIAAPFPKAAPPPPKSDEEIAASAAAQATADENTRRRAEAEAAAEFDRATYLPVAERELALLAKDPAASRDKKMMVYGHVTQFDSVTGTGMFLAAIRATPGASYTFDLNVLVSGQAAVLAPVAEGDYVTIYGVFTGSRSYENRFGGTVTAATMTASIIDITG